MPKILWYTDSIYNQTGGAGSTLAQIIAASRADYTHAFSTVGGRRSDATDLPTVMAANPGTTDVYIALGVNDPAAGLGYSAQACVERLALRRAEAFAAGASRVYVATPMHCPTGLFITPPIHMEQFTGAVAEILLAQGWHVIDARSAVTADQWLAGCLADRVHPWAPNLLRTIADYIAPRLP